MRTIIARVLVSGALLVLPACSKTSEPAAVGGTAGGVVASGDVLAERIVGRWTSAAGDLELTRDPGFLEARPELVPPALAVRAAGAAMVFGEKGAYVLTSVDGRDALITFTPWDDAELGTADPYGSSDAALVSIALGADPASDVLTLGGDGVPTLELRRRAD